MKNNNKNNPVIQKLDNDFLSEFTAEEKEEFWFMYKTANKPLTDEIIKKIYHFLKINITPKSTD